MQYLESSLRKRIYNYEYKTKYESEYLFRMTEEVVTNYKFKQGRQCTYKHNIEACSCNPCCRGKAISIT